MLERDLARDLAAGDYRRRRWERHAVERELLLWNIAAERYGRTRW